MTSSSIVTSAMHLAPQTLPLAGAGAVVIQHALGQIAPGVVAGSTRFASKSIQAAAPVFARSMSTRLSHSAAQTLGSAGLHYPTTPSIRNIGLNSMPFRSPVQRMPLFQSVESRRSFQSSSAQQCGWRRFGDGHGNNYYFYERRWRGSVIRFLILGGLIVWIVPKFGSESFTSLPSHPFMATAYDHATFTTLAVAGVGFLTLPLPLSLLGAAGAVGYAFSKSFSRAKDLATNGFDSDEWEIVKLSPNEWKSSYSRYNLDPFSEYFSRHQHHHRHLDLEDEDEILELYNRVRNHPKCRKAARVYLKAGIEVEKEIQRREALEGKAYPDFVVARSVDSSIVVTLPFDRKMIQQEMKTRKEAQAAAAAGGAPAIQSKPRSRKRTDPEIESL
ncbi:uncharacterized protein BJ171DRAFT_511036 [Polychytrium aggregatum]|uniref:uncharacterized protein n=1 Tax=Polychytrium aggregatum TaxID=110093 RepID=UPI0022FF307D|nr:uncharacterized protein BJ171DRAFT_511036 [Polychytrium aggregatum]KAI9203171.1 hypothetical protein BJ171DRAFT_511036 [Polychytrium aggregatum]